MKADRRGACIEWAGVGADHTLAEIGDLQPLVPEVALDKLRHRPVEEQQLVLLRRRRAVLRSARAWAARRSTDRRCTLMAQAHRRRRRITSLMARQPSTSPGASARTSSAHRSSSSQSWTLEPSRKGTKRPVDRGRPSVSAPRQFQFFDHQRMQQSGKIGAGRHAHAGEGLLDGAGAANALPALDHQHALAGPRKIGRASQAVVACADNDHVPGSGCQLANGDRQSDFAEHFGSG